MNAILIAALACLTRPDGLAVCVRSDAIETVMPVPRGLADPRARTQLQFQSGRMLYVREAPDAAVEALNK